MGFWGVFEALWSLTGEMLQGAVELRFAFKIRLCLYFDELKIIGK